MRSVNNVCSKGVTHKPRGQLKGEGVSQMTILLHKPYLVKVITKGEGVKNTKKLIMWFMDDPLGLNRSSYFVQI